MPNVVVTLEYGDGNVRDLGLPLDVSCKALTIALAQAFKLDVDINEGLTLVEKDASGGRKLTANATLGDMGILHGTRLTLENERKKIPDVIPQGGVSLKLENGREVLLKGVYTLIGRRDPKHNIYPDFDLGELDSGKISSRQHATIEFDQRSYVIKDLRSANGTWVNGQRLQPETAYQIKNGDEIVFGRNGIKVHFKRGE